MKEYKQIYFNDFEVHASFKKFRANRRGSDEIMRVMFTFLGITKTSSRYSKVADAIN